MTVKGPLYDIMESMHARGLQLQLCSHTGPDRELDSFRKQSFTEDAVSYPLGDDRNERKIQLLEFSIDWTLPTSGKKVAHSTRT